MRKNSTAVADIRPDFDSALIARMQAAGITNQALADKVNVSKCSIIYYRTGRRKPRPNVLQKIANALDVSVKDFLQ